jgi:hypothetical protein
MAIDELRRTSNPSSRRETATHSTHASSWWLELLMIGAFYFAYERTRAAAPTHPGRALRHAKDMISLERSLHLNVEGPINRLLAHHNLLGAVSAYYYGALHFVVTGGVLLWLYVRRPQIYRRARRTIVTASFSALFVFWLFPVAPPRLAVPGMTDIVVKHNVFIAAHAATSGGFVDIYAALPSLHVGWAMWVALCLYRANPTRRWRLAFWLYPLTTTLVVLGTANHYTLDALAGAAVILGADAVLRLTGPAFTKVPIPAVMMKLTRSSQMPKPSDAGGQQAENAPSPPSLTRVSASAAAPRMLTFAPSRRRTVDSSRDKATVHNRCARSMSNRDVRLKGRS